MKYFDPHEQQYHSKYNRAFTKYLYRIKLLWYKYICKRRIFAIAPWISMSWGRVEHNNWGDDINVFFLSHIASDVLLPREVYAQPKSIYFKGMSNFPIVYTIGSVLHLVSEDNAIIWGSGLINEKLLPPIKSITIKAVRGPLTRKVLMDHGFDCPQVYGDPALLLPLYYHPRKIKKKIKLGIIPHYVDENKAELSQFKNDDSITIIHMTGYRNWTDVINQILSCECVASSSLHGIIISEAYGVPNLWVEIKEPIVGDSSRRFKFHDFFQSIGLDREAPFSIQTDTKIEDIINQCLKYKKAPGLNLQPLIDACPFKLKNQRYE